MYYILKFCTLKVKLTLLFLLQVQMVGSNEFQIAEMHYYTTIAVGEETQALALASFYGPKDEVMYAESKGTYWTAKHMHRLEFIPVQCIKQLVMMAPDSCYGVDHTDGTEVDRWYMMRKPGVGLLGRLGLTDEEPDLDDNQVEIVD